MKLPHVIEVSGSMQLSLAAMHERRIITLAGLHISTPAALLVHVFSYRYTGTGTLAPVHCHGHGYTATSAPKLLLLTKIIRHALEVAHEMQVLLRVWRATVRHCVRVIHVPAVLLAVVHAEEAAGPQGLLDLPLDSPLQVKLTGKPHTMASGRADTQACTQTQPALTCKCMHANTLPHWKHVCTQ